MLPGALKEQGTEGRVPFGVISIYHLGFSQEQSLGCVTAAWMDRLAGQYVGTQLSHGDGLCLGFHRQVLSRDRYAWGWRVEGEEGALGLAQGSAPGAVFKIKGQQERDLTGYRRA